MPALELRDATLIGFFYIINMKQDPEKNAHPVDKLKMTTTNFELLNAASFCYKSSIIK